MTPDLIALLLALPLPVRLALLDAEPTGPGWYVNDQGASIHESVKRCEASEDLHMPYRIDNGAAWLPCNPLAIAHHAAKLAYGGASSMATCCSAGWVFCVGQWTGPRGSLEMPFRVVNACPYTAAIALLREVVGG